jgi:hypothetical protein
MVRRLSRPTVVVHSGWTASTIFCPVPNNFVESYNPKADPAALIDQPGERYEVTLTVF